MFNYATNISANVEVQQLGVAGSERYAVQKLLQVSVANLRRYAAVRWHSAYQQCAVMRCDMPCQCQRKCTRLAVSAGEDRIMCVV